MPSIWKTITTLHNHNYDDKHTDNNNHNDNDNDQNDDNDDNKNNDNDKHNHKLQQALIQIKDYGIFWESGVRM